MHPARARRTRGGSPLKPTTSLVIVAMLAFATAPIGAGLPDPCMSPPLQGLCVVLVGDVTVEDDDTVTLENNTYGMTGTITVRDNGTLVLQRADFLYGSQSVGIHIRDNGTLIIRFDAELLSANVTGTTLIVADPGTHVLIAEATLRGMTFENGSNDTHVSNSTFRDSRVAIRSTGANITIENNLFRDLDLAINVTDGTAIIRNNTFQDVWMGIELVDSPNYQVRDNVMSGMEYGLFSLRSDGGVVGNLIYEDFDPPSVGMAFWNSTLVTNVVSNVVGHFGIGLFTCDANVTLSGNDFDENADPTRDCDDL